MARYIWHEGAWVEIDTTAPRPRPVAPMVIRDIEAYREVFTGTRIRSRRHHRDFLRAHKLVEVGNEYSKGVPLDKAPEAPGMTQRARREAIERAYQQVSEGGGRKTAGTEGDL